MPRRYDLVVVGAGSGGMSAAEFAATLGLKVALVERERVGGDCLWTGCVPSKALLAAAKAAHAMRTADRFGLPAVDPEVDTEAVWERVRAVQRSIAGTDDSPERFRALGVDVVAGAARLVGPHRVAVAGADGGPERRLDARFVLLCPGSRPAVPDVAGLAEAGFLTNDTVFELERAPASVVFVGGGPIAVELAQALRRLGLGVTVLQKGPTVLPRDEPELAGALARVLRDEGVEVVTGAAVEAVAAAGGAKRVRARVGGEVRTFEAEEVLVATGRRPDVAGLGLEAQGVAVGERGIEVDDRMRTAVPSVYAAGDAVGRELFTHAAGHQAVRAVRDMFFPGRGRPARLVPWCTFTDPELASAGLTFADARRAHGGSARAWRFGLDHSDRARAEAAPEGAVVVVTAGREGRIVGAHVLAPAAGEVVHELALAIEKGMTLPELAGLVHVYPTVATAVGQLAAGAAYERARRYRWAMPLARLAHALGR